MNVQENLLQHPARTKLDGMSRSAPHGLWARLEARRQSHPPELAQEYLGYQEVLHVFDEVLDPQVIAAALAKSNASQLHNCISTYHTLATWRISQGIYRFDPDVFLAMRESEFAGEVPGDLMLRLPERCVYIDTPGLNFCYSTGVVSPMVGFWARVEARPERGENMLVVQPLPADVVRNDNYLHSYRVDLSMRLDRWAEEAVESTVQMYEKAGDPRSYEAIRATFEQMKGWMIPALNLLLYLCSENSEIGGGQMRPGIVQPVQTKRGQRFFPAEAPTKWDVAVRLGSALRAAKVESDHPVDGGNGEKRPHIRRAHWHGVRTGPMKRADGTPIPAQDRRFELRWLPPIPVKVTSFDELPATIRPVTA